MTFPLQKTSILVISNSEQRYSEHQCLSALHQTLDMMLASPRGCPHSESSYFILVLVINNFDQNILVIKILCFRCAIKVLRIWHLFIWKLCMLHRESKKLLLNDSDQSISARAAPPFMLIWWHYVTLCLPNVLTSKSGGHVSEQFRYSGLSIFYNCWFVFFC